MGVSWVFEAEQNAQSLERLLEINGADNIGPFTVDVTPFVPPAQHQIEIPLNYVVHHSKYPQTTFSIAPSGNAFKKSPRAVCDRGFDLILSQMKNGISADNMGKIEISGIEYKLFDFRVRVGTATQVTTVKGVVVEVEFEPSNLAHLCKDMMIEFIDALFQKYTDTVPECFNVVGEKAEAVTPSDTVWQYVQIASKLRKKT